MTGERRLQDASLPTLSDAVDRDDLSRAFTRLWRTCEGAAVRIALGERLHAVYAPGVACVATYAVTVERADRHWASIGLVEIDPAGTRHRRFAADPSLPGLATAADGEAMRDRLRLALDPISEVRNCDASPVGYKPGTSCVLRYVLRTDRTVLSTFGKVFADNLDRHAATLSALAPGSVDAADFPSVPPPLAVWPDLGLILQPAVAGASLSSAALDPSAPASVRAARMRAAGRGLAAFHAGATAPGPVRTWDEDLDDLAVYRPLFAHLTPPLEGPIDELVRGLRELTATLPEPTRVASHGAFRTDQVIVGADGRPAFLDLDGYCWADPARDVANALAYLEWRAIRAPEDAAPADAARRALLDGYATFMPAPDPGWLRAYRAATMLKIAGRRLRRLAFSEWSALPALVERARGVLSAVR